MSRITEVKGVEFVEDSEWVVNCVEGSRKSMSMEYWLLGHQ